MVRWMVSLENERRPVPRRTSFPWGGRPSELKLKRQLDGAGAADLVEGVEAAGLATGAEVVVQHLCRLAELRRTQIIDRVAEVRVVQDVEEIASRLKSDAFGEVELAAQGQVPLGGGEAAEGIAAEIALRGGGHRGGEGVDDLSSGCVWLIEAPGNDIRTLCAGGLDKKVPGKGYFP